MSTHTASAIRFLRQYRAPTLTPTYASLTAAKDVFAGLKSSPWTKIASNKAAILPSHEEIAGVPTALDYYDAYELCAEHSDAQHRAYGGCAAYRITLPDAAAGMSLTSLSVAVTSCPYNPGGSRLAVATSASGSAVPSTDFTVIRGGAAAGCYAAAVAPRTVSADLKTWYGATATATITPTGGLVLGKYLWVFVSLENYERARNGWLEGSSRLDPMFTLTLPAAIAGYSDADWIGGGYDLETHDSLVLAQADVAVDFPRQMSTVTGTSVVRRTFMREFFFSCAQVYSASNAAGWRALAGLLQGAALGKFNASSVIPATADDSLTNPMTYLDFKSNPSLLLGTTYPQYLASQFGLVAHIQHTAAVGTPPAANAKWQRLTMRLCPYIVPVGDPPFTPSRLVVKNGAAALSLGGVGVRLTAWWVPDYSAFYATDYPLYPIHALASLPAFWLGSSDSITGSITDVTGTSDATVLTYSLTATKLGRVTLPDSIAANQEVEIPMSAVPSSRGMIVLAPFVIDAGPSLAAATVKGLSPAFLYTSASDNTGWRPEVRLDA